MLKNLKTFESNNAKFIQFPKEKNPKSILSFYNYIVSLLPSLNNLLTLNQMIKNCNFLRLNFIKLKNRTAESKFLKEFSNHIENPKTQSLVKGKKKIDLP